MSRKRLGVAVAACAELLLITGGRAQVLVCLRRGCRPQKLRKTDEGWKIDEFQMPVND